MSDGHGGVFKENDSDYTFPVDDGYYKDLSVDQEGNTAQAIELLKSAGFKFDDKPNFFVTHTDMPYKITDYTLDSYVRQMRLRVLDRMTEVFGVDTSDAAIRKAVEEHNEVCRIISEISEMRKADNPVITGYEFHVLNLVTYCCPKALILPYLRETLAELKTRKPDKKSPFRARVAIVGSEIDDPNLTTLIFHSL